MGGGPDKETLVVIWANELKHLTDDIQRRFPYIDVIFHQLGKPQGGKQMGGIPYAFDAIPEGMLPSWKTLPTDLSWR